MSVPRLTAAICFAKRAFTSSAVAAGEPAARPELTPTKDTSTSVATPSSAAFVGRCVELIVP